MKDDGRDAEEHGTKDFEEATNRRCEPVEPGTEDGTDPETAALPAMLMLPAFLLRL